VNASQRVVLAAGAALALLASVAALYAGSLKLLVAVMAMLALVAISYLALWASPALFFSLALASEVLNGNAKLLHLPIAPERVFVVAGLASLALRLPGAVVTRSIVWRPVHVLLGMLAAYATVSAVASHSITNSDTIFSLLDRLGVVPFLVFTLAPVVFGNRRSRDVLLVALVVLGTYLGITAVGEGLHLSWLVYPKYILDPSVGLHYGRARGPFNEAVANGLGLYGCAVASAVAFVVWADRRPRLRLYAAFVAVLCLGGTIFTLTRAIWLATVVATLLTLLANHRTRALLAPTVGVGLAVLAAAIFFVPGFASHAEQRQGDQGPIWDRYNSDAAAVRAVKDQPLFGIGWQQWRHKNTEYLRLAQNYPLTGTDIDIHNVPLSHAAELGLIGLGLWAAAVAAGIGGAILRRGPTELDPWRLGMVALAVHWLIVANFGPLSYPFPNLLLWLWAGVCSIGHLGTRAERPAVAPSLLVPV
jgi:O-antigen ligase